MGKDPNVALVEKQVSEAVKRASAFEVNTPESMLEAGELRKKIKSVGKLLKDQKEKITKPLNEGLKQARALFAPLEENYEQAEKIISGKMLFYQNICDQETRDIEAKAAADLKKIEDDAKAGKITEHQAEVKEQKIEQKLEQAPGVITKSKDFHTREIQKFRIVNMDAIPREFMLPDEVAIRKAMMAGIPVEGVEYYKEKSLV